MNQTDVDYLKELYHSINKVYPLALITIGTIGNFLTIYIYTRKEFFKTSTGFYFSFLAIIDTLMLYFGLFKFFLEGISQIDIHYESEFNCKFFKFTVNCLAETSAWITVVVSLDRLFIVMFPNSYKISQNKVYQIILVLLIIALISIINTPNLVFLKVVVNNETELYCDNENIFYLFIFNLLDLLLSFLIPFLIVIVSSILLIVKLKQSKNRVLVNTKATSKNISNFVSTVISKDLTFVTLNLPICLTIVINSYRFTFYEAYNDYEVWIVNLTYCFSNMLLYLNYSINFFVHFCMNKYFKRKLLKTLRIKNKK